MASEPPFRVLIAGGGVAALEAALTLHDLAGDALDVTLLAPDEHFRFRPMAVAEPFGTGQAGTLALGTFARDVGARHHTGALEAVDAPAGEARLQSGERLQFDALLLAVGARPVPAIPSATTWFDDADPDMFGGLLRDMEGGYSRRVAFVVPPGCGWPLPLYELALMTAREVQGMGIDGAEVTIVTYEAAPLSLFGPRASTAVAGELEAAGVSILTASYVDPDRSQPGTLALRPGGGTVEAQRIVALPRLEAHRIEGVPANRDGFTPVDYHGRVIGLEHVWAAGDDTAFPIKQGGLATQQAEAAATGIAVAAGLDVEETPWEPVLRGTLLTGRQPWHLRWSPGDGDGQATRQPLWWPPTKVAGHRLSPYLAAHPEAPTGMPVEVRVGPSPPHPADGGLADLDPRPQPALPRR